MIMVGIGLRPAFLSDLLENSASAPPAIDFLELLSDDYLGGDQRRITERKRVCERYPVSVHGVGMSLGSVDPLNNDYLTALRDLVNETNPITVSDHLCWTSVHGQYLHDLLPLPYTEETVEHVSSRIAAVQEFLGREILIENISTYLNFKDSTMSEAQFVAAVAEKAQCGILLDVNNVYVNACNHGGEAEAFLSELPINRIKQMHLGGFEEREHYLLDAHSRPVAKPVWDLFRTAITRCGSLPVVLEWDNDLPEFSVIMEQVAQARALMSKLL